MEPDEKIGPECFGGSDEESHYMSQERINLNCHHGNPPLTICNECEAEFVARVTKDKETPEIKLLDGDAERIGDLCHEIGAQHIAIKYGKGVIAEAALNHVNQILPTLIKEIRKYHER